MNNISRQMLLNFSRENEEFIYNFGKFSDFKEKIRDKVDDPRNRKTRQAIRELASDAKETAMDIGANAFIGTRDFIRKIKNSPVSSKKKVFYELMKSVKLVDFLDACELSIKHYDRTNARQSELPIGEDVNKSLELIKHFADLIFDK